MLTRITAMIRESAPVAMVILFGSHARGNWVDDPANRYMSDFDILGWIGRIEPGA
jgi:predicted nucleotidyltransferase